MGNEADVREYLRIVKPEITGINGLNGLANRRNVGYGLESGAKEHVKSMNEVAIVLMIEKKEIIED